MTAYGVLLRRLMDFTGSKLCSVADEVGYDVSYISKWCNKELLPSAKTVHVVSKALGRYFANSIRQDGQEAAFRIAFSGPPSQLPLDQFIRTLLTDAYEASAQEKLPHASVGMDLLTRRQEILDCLRDLGTRRRKLGGEIVCTIDLLTLLDSRDFSVLDQLPGQGELHLHAALDLAHFQQDPEGNLYLLYAFLSRYHTLFVTLYDGSGLEREGLLAARDGEALMVAINGSGEIDALLVSKAGPEAAHLYDTAMTRLKDRPVLLSPARPEEMNQNGYRTDFYSRDQFRFFSLYGFEFLLPGSICENLIRAGRTGRSDSSLPCIIRRLFITWEEVFQKSSIDFFLLKSSALRYLESGELLFADIHYQMSPSERLEHLEQIKEQVQRNPNIRFIVFEDDAFPPDSVPAFSAYMNPKKLFLKNPTAYRTEKGPMFYTVLSQDLIQTAARYLDSLKDDTRCKIYDSKDIVELENRYGAMLYRMLTLQEEES